MVGEARLPSNVPSVAVQGVSQFVSSVTAFSFVLVGNLLLFHFCSVCLQFYSLIYFAAGTTNPSSSLSMYYH